MGMGMKSLIWEGIGMKNLFPHISSLGALLECIVTIIGTVFIYFEKYLQMVGFSRVSWVSRVST